MINLPGSDISITSPKPRREHTAAPSILPSELGYTGQLCHNAVVERGAMFRRRTPGDGFGDQIGVSRQTFHFYGRRGKCDPCIGADANLALPPSLHSLLFCSDSDENNAVALVRGRHWHPY